MPQFRPPGRFPEKHTKHRGRRDSGQAYGRSRLDGHNLGGEGDTMAETGSKPNPTQIQKFLGGMDYPANKQTLVDHARGQGAPDDVMQTLENLPDREYDGPNGVIKELY